MSKERNPRVMWRETMKKNVSISNRSTPYNNVTSKPKVSYCQGQDHAKENQEPELKFSFQHYSTTVDSELESNIYMSHETEIERLFQQNDECNNIVLTKCNVSVTTDIDGDCKSGSTYRSHEAEIERLFQLNDECNNIALPKCNVSLTSDKDINCKSGSSSIENTPRCSPIQIKPGFLHESITQEMTCLPTERISSHYKKYKNAPTTQASPVAAIKTDVLNVSKELPADTLSCDEKSPPSSPVLPISPQTTKLLHVLANESDFYINTEFSLLASPFSAAHEDSHECITNAKCITNANIPMRICNLMQAGGVPSKESVESQPDPLLLSGGTSSGTPDEKCVESAPESLLMHSDTSSGTPSDKSVERAIKTGVLAVPEEFPADTLLCDKEIPPSPVPPMSPQTTKLIHILANDSDFYINIETSLPASPSSATNDNSRECITNVNIPMRCNLMQASVVPSKDSVDSQPDPLLSRRGTASGTPHNNSVESAPTPLLMHRDTSSGTPGKKSGESALTPLVMHEGTSSGTPGKKSSESTPAPLVMSVEVPVKKTVERGPNSLLIPVEIPKKSINSALDCLPMQEVSSKQNILPESDKQEPGEKSIEAPPYSPLTPVGKSIELAPHCLLEESNKQNALPEPDKEEPGEMSIEPPPYSPLTPKPMQKIFLEKNERFNKRKSAHDYDKESVLYDDYLEKSGYSENSDDSVKDPDYKCDEDASSDKSSEKSFSIITSLADIHNSFNTVTYCLNTNKTKTIPEGKDINTDIEPMVRNESIDSTDVETDENVTGSIVQDNTDPMSTPLEETLNETSLIGTETYTGRPRKGRKRKFGELTREERKRRKYMNLSYVNSRKKEVGPKPFLDWKCSCTKKCHELISVEKRLSEFKKFYALGSYNAQNMYLAACVKEQPVKRSYVTTNTKVSKKKSYSRKYLLQGIPVCREMFVQSLQTSPKRINTSLCKLRSDECITDKRGLQAGLNRIATERELFLINVIKNLPKYISHYRRNECKDANFLRPGMTFPVIYKQYCAEAATARVQTVSYAKAKQIFLTKFNLRTKSLKKDTCNKCDSYAIKNMHAVGEDKVRIDAEHIAHIDKANYLQQQLKADMLLAKDKNGLTETLTYDLEKTLPLPRIPTNIVFYKRQLWVYNLGIHTGSDDKAYCNVWVEGEAGRGAQEVGSCLLKHILERLKPNVRHLILWSDSCGGQNRNIKLTLMLKALLSDHPTLQQINIRFLESGHSFLPNDTDFGRIECALKLQERLYTPTDYMDVMKNCKKHNPMCVHKMNKEDFFSSSKLESIITNRKKAVDGSKVSWLNTKELMLKKENMFSIYMRADLEADFIEINIKKNARGRHAVISKNIMEPLWPNGKPIPMPKLEDIKSLMHLIPKDAQGFYKTLTGDEGIEDDVDGFSGTPDFELEFHDVESCVIEE